MKITLIYQLSLYFSPHLSIFSAILHPFTQKDEVSIGKSVFYSLILPLKQTKRDTYSILNQKERFLTGKSVFLHRITHPHPSQTAYLSQSL